MNSQELSVLLVEDNPDDVLLIREALSQSASVGIRLCAVETVRELVLFLQTETCDVILLDLGLPDSQGLDTLAQARALARDIPLVVITGLDNEELGLQALNHGAQDYLIKGRISPPMLVRSLRYAIERHRLLKERDRHLQQLEESEARFRQVIEKSADAIVIADLDGIVRFVNPATETLFRKQQKDLVGSSLGFTVESGEPAEFEWTEPGGAAVTVESRAVRINWESKPAYLISLRDVTERKRAEQLLEKNEQLYRNAIRAANAVAYYKDYAKETYEYVGEGILALTGYPASEFTPELFDSLQYEVQCLGPLKGLPIEEAIRRAQEEDVDWRADYRIRTREGEERWLANAAVQVRDEQGRAIGSLGLFQDITERKATERQLNEINRALERRVAERTQSLRHYQEQLQAMTAKLTLTEQTERRRLATELHDSLAQNLVVCKMRIAQLLPSQENAATHLKGIDQLLDQSLKYTRTLIAELSPTVLYELGLTAAIHWLAEQMKQHGLTVRVQADKEALDLPEYQATLLYQSIRELLFNVVKHAGVGEATVWLRRMGKYLVVSIIDKGAGFDKTLKGTDPTVIGHYGLFSIRERLEAMGGILEIQSMPAQGTHVQLYVPLADRTNEAKASAARPRHEAVRTSDRAQLAGAALRLVIADDHALVRMGIRSILEMDTTLQVLAEAANGEEAVDLARSLQPDAILMDINMPRLNGIEATRIIKQENPEITVIGLSVQDDREVELSMKAAGADAYFAKGGPFEELSRVLHSLHHPASPENAKTNE